MAKHLLTLAYDGSAFAGFQVQKNARTVQSAMQDAIEKIYGERLPVVGCSRTDAGVHARDYKLTFETGAHHPAISEERIPAALNAMLPQEIAVLFSQAVPESFHVRHDVWEKEYEYVIRNTPYRDPFTRVYAYHYRHPIDTAMLHEAAQAFVGTHDFRAFMASGSDIADTTRTVRAVSVVRDGAVVRLRIAADGFLYNMVRIFVGTMLGTAEGKIAAASLPDIIASGDRARAGITVPACGLYLNRVTYKNPAVCGKE